MPVYKKYPLLRLLLAFCVGLAGYEYGYISPPVLLLLAVLGTLPLSILLLGSFRTKIRWKPAIGVSLLLLFIALGAIRGWLHDDKRKTDCIGHLPDSTYTIIATIAAEPSRKTKTYQTELIPIAVSEQKHWTYRCGSILLWIDTALQQQYRFHPGDTIMARLRLQSLSGKRSPLPDGILSNYHHRQLYQQAYLGYDQLQAQQPDSDKNIPAVLRATRDRILRNIATHITGREEQGLAQALLIGYKEDLSKSLENAYRDAGIVHIIAISGMHLVLIYAFFNKIMEGIFRNTGRPLLAGISLLLCWIFAFLTGAGPSVMRAALMLSFLVMGPLLGRQANSLNSLLASAFLLVLVQPEWLWNVGFWLSYSAVLSILLWYKPILSLRTYDNQLLQKVWELIAVTLAAQLLTLPIILYCFGTFPTYFLFANLLMIPLSSLILYGLLLLQLVGWIPYINTFLENLTTQFIHWMNLFVRYIAQYPGVNIPYAISFLQMLLLYAIMFLAYHLIQKRKDQKQWAASFDPQYV